MPRSKAGVAPKSTALDRRALNRALLARQHLLERARMPALRMIEHLVGLQAQDPKPPYIGLWTRVADFDPTELSSLLENRAAVRLALMRSTIHLVSARDAIAIRPLVQPAIERSTMGGYGRVLAGVDLDRLASEGRELLEAEPMTFARAGALLAERFDAPPQALASALRAFVPLVQIPPRGLWGASGAAAHTTVDAWLESAPHRSMTAEQLMLRYLGAFGPASSADAQAWSGLTRLSSVFERIRPKLAVFTDENGRELFDLQDAPRPERDTPAPVRLLPPFDNVLLSHADRSRVIDADSRRAIATLNGMVPGAVLVDGFFSGAWRTRIEKRDATIAVRWYTRVTKAETKEVEMESLRLLTMLAPDHTHAVDFEART